jgi:peptidoglycan/LPS O-acetylase OafA/YrhL
MTRSAEPQHFAFLDALRGIAALAVVAVHTVQNFSAGWFSSVFGQGAAGVQLFYVVSAYSLCLSFEQRRSVEQSPLKTYVIRRFFRIAPLFWFAVLVYLLKSLIFPTVFVPVDVHPPTWSLAPWHVITTLLFVNGWHYQSINFIVPGGWSVAVESNFYLLLPVLLRVSRTLRQAVVLVLSTLALAVVCRKALYVILAGNVAENHLEAFGIFAGLWLPSQLPVFALGIVMLYLVPRSSLTQAATVPTRRLLLPLALCLGAGAYAVFAPAALERVVPLTFQKGLILLGFSWLVAWWPIGLFVNRVTVFVGKISYSLYLFHFIALHLVVWASSAFYVPRFGSPPSFFLTFPCVLVIGCGLARITYQLIEVPGQTLGRRIIKQLG